MEQIVLGSKKSYSPKHVRWFGDAVCRLMEQPCLCPVHRVSVLVRAWEVNFKEQNIWEETWSNPATLPVVSASALQDSAIENSYLRIIFILRSLSVKFFCQIFPGSISWKSFGYSWIVQKPQFISYQNQEGILWTKWKDTCKAGALVQLNFRGCV